MAPGSNAPPSKAWLKRASSPWAPPSPDTARVPHVPLDRDARPERTNHVARGLFEEESKKTNQRKMHVVLRQARLPLLVDQQDVLDTSKRAHGRCGKSETCQPQDKRDDAGFATITDLRGPHPNKNCGPSFASIRSSNGKCAEHKCVWLRAYRWDKTFPRAQIRKRNALRQCAPQPCFGGIHAAPDAVSSPCVAVSRTEKLVRGRCVKECKKCATFKSQSSAQLLRPARATVRSAYASDSKPNGGAARTGLHVPRSSEARVPFSWSNGVVAEREGGDSSALYNSASQMTCRCR
jgi:hypothetical protein